MGIRANTRVRFTAAALLVAIAAGCGGGGDGGGGGAAPEAPMVPLPPEAGPQPIPQVLEWGVFPAASVVIGQPDLVSGATPPPGAGLDRLELPDGAAAISADGVLFVSAVGGLRAFEDYAASNGPTARFSIAAGALGASIRGSQLVYVADNEVRIHNSLPTDGGTPADVRIGGGGGCVANDLQAPRHAIITPLGQLVVADTMHHRVLIWNSIPRAGENADFVVGQRFKNVCEANDLDGDGTGNSFPQAHTLKTPTSVWSDGVKLVVADSGNHRVLIYDFPVEDAPQATILIGQEDFGDQAPNGGHSSPSDITLFTPTSVDVRESGQMAVSDSDNHRVLIWDTFPTQNSQAANQVIGQSAFGRNAANAGGTTAANTLVAPSGVRFHERNLIVTDRANHRVLIFPPLN